MTKTAHMTDVLVESMMQRCLDLAREAASVGNYALGALRTSRNDRHQGRGARDLVTVPTRRLSGQHLGAVPHVHGCGDLGENGRRGLRRQPGGRGRGSRENPHPTFTWRQIMIPAAEVAAAGRPTITVQGGVRRSECQELFAMTR